MFTRALSLSSLILAASFAQAIQPAKAGSAQATQQTQQSQMKTIQLGPRAAQASQSALPVEWSAGPLGGIYSSGWGYLLLQLTVSSPPNNTCLFYGWQFVLDTSTQAGKNAYALVLLAEATGKSISIMYQDSSTPGTNQTNGCTPATMAVAQDAVIY
jgi:hypothetical protein